MVSVSKTIYFFAIAVLFIFVSISFFGVSHLLGMKMNSSGEMSGCLFSGKAEICTMTFLAHLLRWREMFIATIHQNALAFALLILFSVVFVVVAIFKRKLFLLFSYYAAYWRLYIKQNQNFSLFNPLREAFSQGILNPKIY